MKKNESQPDPLGPMRSQHSELQTNQMPQNFVTSRSSRSAAIAYFSENKLIPDNEGHEIQV